MDQQSAFLAFLLPRDCARFIGAVRRPLPDTSLPL